MLFPRCGKVLVIDDQVEEAVPLLNLLGKKGVSTMYYSGSLSELPESPFNEIRLVFCDLKFNVATDPKSVASNVFSILKSLISEENGPIYFWYGVRTVLIIWTNYKKHLKQQK